MGKGPQRGMLWERACRHSAGPLSPGSLSAGGIALVMVPLSRPSAWVSDVCAESP